MHALGLFLLYKGGRLGTGKAEVLKSLVRGHLQTTETNLDEGRQEDDLWQRS